jgi:hypothetical protein
VFERVSARLEENHSQQERGNVRRRCNVSFYLL